MTVDERCELAYAKGYRDASLNADFSFWCEAGVGAIYHRYHLEADNIPGGATPLQKTPLVFAQSDPNLLHFDFWVTPEWERLVWAWHDIRWKRWWHRFTRP